MDANSEQLKSVESTRGMLIVTLQNGTICLFNESELAPIFPAGDKDILSYFNLNRVQIALKLDKIMITVTEGGKPLTNEFIPILTFGKEYKDVSVYSKFLAAKKEEGAECGVYTINGEIILKHEFRYACEMGNLGNRENNECKDYIIVCDSKHLLGLYNLSGDNILPHEYDCIFGENGIIIASKSWLYGAYDKNGRLLVPHEYDSIRYDGGSEAIVRKCDSSSLNYGHKPRSKDEPFKISA